MDTNGFSVHDFVYFLYCIVIVIFECTYRLIQILTIAPFRLKADSSLSLGEVTSINLTKIQVKH